MGSSRQTRLNAPQPQRVAYGIMTSMEEGSDRSDSPGDWRAAADPNSGLHNHLADDNTATETTGLLDGTHGRHDRWDDFQGLPWWKRPSVRGRSRMLTHARSQ